MSFPRSCMSIKRISMGLVEARPQTLSMQQPKLAFNAVCHRQRGHPRECVEHIGRARATVQRHLNKSHGPTTTVSIAQLNNTRAYHSCAVPSGSAIASSPPPTPEEWAETLLCASRHQTRAMHQRGEIHLILGPMFAGKTTELLRRVRRHTVAKRKCVVVKYARDNRYSEELAATHDNSFHQAVNAERISDAASELEHAHVVAIDEGQFFPDLVEQTQELANKGKLVIVSALDGTFEQKPFGRVLELVPLSESVAKLTSVCMTCQEPAAFSTRLTEDKSIELLGGAEKYISTCRLCSRLDKDTLRRILALHS